VLSVRYSVYGEKRPVTPSELWNNKRIMKILTQSHQYSAINVSVILLKNAFSENKNVFHYYSCTCMHGHICVYMDATLLVSGANFSSVPLLRKNNVLFLVSNSKRARRKKSPSRKEKKNSYISSL